MNKKNTPPWLQQLWKELTTPPAIMRSKPSDAPAARSKAALNDRVLDEDAEELTESPTDPDDTPKPPQHSTKHAERISRQYFSPKKVGKPITKPRPKRPSRSSTKKKSTYTQADIVTAVRSSAPTAPNRINRKKRRPNPAALTDWSTKIVAIEPVNGIWRCQAEDGTLYALKQARIPVARLRFLASVCDELHKQGFHEVPNIVKTTSGNPFLFDGDEFFYAYEWMPGIPMRYESLRQIGDAARTLARFHLVSKRLPPLGTSIRPYPLADDMRQKQADLVALAEVLKDKSGLDEYDQLLASQLRSALAQGNHALAMLTIPEVETTLNDGNNGLCHLDVTANNLIVHPNGNVQLIDLELVNRAPRVVDLSHLLRRAMQARGTWSSEVAIIPVVAYNRIDPLQHGEYLLLEALLTFPYRLHRLQKNRYSSKSSSRTSTPAQLLLLKKAILLEADRQSFLRAYSQQVTRHNWSDV